MLGKAIGDTREIRYHEFIVAQVEWWVPLGP